MTAKISRSVYADMFRVGLLAIGVPALAQATDGEDRWRFAEHEGQASLYIAYTDLGTDNIGPGRFSCKRASGLIEFDADMDLKEREAFAELIKRDGYPSVELIPASRDRGSLAQPLYSEMFGWLYRFDFLADTEAFSNFVKTGIFRFKIGNAVIGTSFSVGLENAAKFQSFCRKARSR